MRVPFWVDGFVRFRVQGLGLVVLGFFNLCKGSFMGAKLIAARRVCVPFPDNYISTILNPSTLLLGPVKGCWSMEVGFGSIIEGSGFGVDSRLDSSAPTFWCAIQ